MKRLYKLTIVLLVALMLTGCFDTKITKTESSEVLQYLEALKNYSAKEKNENNIVANTKFDDFLDNIFIEAVTDSYIYLHNSVQDYQKLNIEKPKVEWGEIEYSDEGDSAKYIEDLEELKEFDYDSLSYTQQYDYDLYEYSLLETIVSAYFQKYDLLFSQGTDFLSNIYVTLDEFVFYDEESLDDYLILLKDTDRYIDDAITYTRKQAENGIYTSDSSIDYTIDYINSFVSKTNDNGLIISFKNRIEELDIDETKKNECINKNKDLIINEIIPSFNKVKDCLNEYKGKGSDSDLALCNINPNYAETTFILNTSCNDSIDDLFNDTKDVLDELWADFNTALYSDEAINEYYEIYENINHEAFSKDDKGTLEYLEKALEKRYPKLNESKYEVSRLDEASASDSVIAYYVSPPLDNLDLNVIRTNPNEMGYDVISDYTTLAHEGFPGHLYQHMYFQSKNPSRFRETQSFSGYTEGYATYVMVDMLNDADIKNKDTLAMCKFQTVYGYLISSIIDIGVNYYGYTLKDVEEFVKDEGWDNFVSAQGLYQSAIDRPGVLDQYGIGFVEFYKLKEYAKDELKSNFSDIEFNETILKHGPLPFCILKDAVDEYINATKGS